MIQVIIPIPGTLRLSEGGLNFREGLLLCINLSLAGEEISLHGSNSLHLPSEFASKEQNGV